MGCSASKVNEKEGTLPSYTASHPVVKKEVEERPKEVEETQKVEETKPVRKAAPAPAPDYSLPL